jgi:hypothetical protein
MAATATQIGGESVLGGNTSWLMPVNPNILTSPRATEIDAPVASATGLTSSPIHEADGSAVALAVALTTPPALPLPLPTVDINTSVTDSDMARLDGMILVSSVHVVGAMTVETEVETAVAMDAPIILPPLPSTDLLPLTDATPGPFGSASTKNTMSVTLPICRSPCLFKA